ncbi:TetR family transcriptional regulator [Haloechinothrix sp. LS1_15]|uniref:TetR family transcriptional regulator n=1 Tax=Haloechinothrix sp. LS1_15 TaxID=2652248 RepID=UPI002946D5D7|nr:TetR family transcriptional regulator [Haloechinothrix sp. LS1_15]MDV6012764.1 TetR family transcriptional regulator [Haloechinothrix sp. LS1_15]
MEPSSRQERKQRTRQALRDAALRLLTDRTLASVSLREVAKEAGIVPTAFYRHFASLEDLGIELVDESMRTLREMVRDARRNRSDHEDVIASSVATLHAQVRANEDHFRFLIRERYAGTGRVRAAIATELRLFASELAVDLGRFDELRSWNAEDLRMMADLIVTAMLGTVMELIDASGRDADTEITRQARKRLRLIVLGVAGWRSDV